MTAVRWADITRETYEKMVSVALSNEHPNVQRIDGAGGDEGIDAQFQLPGGLRIHQLKFFLGRMTPVRRRQAERSLKRAATHNPREWELVVPIDHTPKERAWFDSMAKKYPFPCRWRGISWLDGLMANNSRVVWYYNSAEQEIVRLLSEWHQGEAALAGGMSEALSQLERVRERMEELNPFFSLEITAGPGGTSVVMRPRYAGAELERPITVSFEGAFPETEEGRAALKRFEEAINYGTPVTLQPEYVASVQVDGPPDLGLAGTFENVTVQMAPVDEEPAWSLDAELVARDAGQHVLASVPVHFIKRHQGQRGFIAYGSDSTATLQVELRV